MVGTTAWVLVEFIGGPRDGELVERSTVPVGPFGHGLNSALNATGAYRAIETSGLTANELDVRAAAERSAIGRFGRGSPDVYLQLVWDDADRRPGAPVDGPAASIQSLAALLDALVAGDSDRALAIALAASKRGAGTVEMIDSYLAPALLTIGRGWQQGELSIFQEHRASGIARRILIEDDRAVTVPRGRAITAVLSGDAHSLPSDMAAHALRDDGWHVDHLGTQTPPQELIDNLEPTDTDLVVLSPTMPANRALSFTTAARLRERGLTVLVGSPGTPVAKLQRQAADVWDGIDQGLRRGQRPSGRP